MMADRGRRTRKLLYGQTYEVFEFRSPRQSRRCLSRRLGTLAVLEPDRPGRDDEMVR
jgi:hypothetical protein